MPKKIKNLFSKSLTFEKLLEAHIRAKKHKVQKQEVLLFEQDLEKNLINLQKSLESGTYSIGKYRTFVIYEPKERIIKALPYTDRVVHQWYVEEFIKPYVIPRFINTTCACITDRGMHTAANHVEKILKQMYNKYGYNFWILKCDIKKFFYSINRDILYNIMQKYITDKKILNLTRILIYSGQTEEKGIPIGNYTSQFFANIYLHELDTFIKRTLKIKGYVRYMDDFVLILKSKQECKQVKEALSVFLKNKLDLEFNDKTKYYKAKEGVNFCGYRIFVTHRLLRKSSKKKIYSKIKFWNKLNNKHELDFPKTLQSFNSWLGHIKHCNSYTLKNKVLSKCNFIYSDRLYEKDEEELIRLIESNKCTKNDITSY